MPNSDEKRNLTIHEFPGFYESYLSQELEAQEEQFLEYFQEDKDRAVSYFGETYGPLVYGGGDDVLEALRSAADHARDWSTMCASLAVSWLEVLEEQITWDLDLPAIKLTFETMTSPRFYNFESDRVFADIPLTDVEAMLAYVLSVNKQGFLDLVEKRHSSRSGFISHYDSDGAAWLEKPIEDWDHNELGTLLSAYIGTATKDRREWFTECVMMRLLDSEAGLQAFDLGFDCDKFTTKALELLAEIAPDECATEAPPPRCDKTLDLFT